MLRVLVNARAARVAGGRTFLVQQLGALAALPDLAITVIAGPAVADDLRMAHDRLRVVECRELPLPFRMAWEQLVLPVIARQFDVVYMTGNFGAILLRPKAQVVALQNALHFGETARQEAKRLSWPTRGRLVAERWLARRSVSSAQAAVAVSETLANEVRSELGEVNVVALPHAAPTRPSVARAIEMDLPERFVLCVAHDYEHKDWDGLIDTFSAELGLPPLVLVGRSRSEARAAQLTERAKVDGEQRAFLLGEIRSRSELAFLYRAASCCIAHSRLESFGFTPHEALANGTAVALSDIDAHREAYQDRSGVFFYAVDADSDRVAAIQAALGAQSPAMVPSSRLAWTWERNAERLRGLLRRAHGAAASGRPRLLVVNQYYDSAEATGQVLLQICQDVADEFAIDVIAAGENKSRASDSGGRVRVRRVGGPGSTRRGTISRAWSYSRFLVGAMLALTRARKPDVVLSFTDPPMLAALVGPWARLRRVPFVFVIQDMHPEVGLVSGRMTSPAMAWALRSSRWVGLRSATAVVAIGEPMAARLRTLGVPSERIYVIPNWTDVNLITPAPRDNAWASAHGTTGRFTFMYSGNVGQVQGLDWLVNALAEIRGTDLLIVGEGSGKAQLEQSVTERGLDSVRFEPFQPVNLLRLALASADVQVVSLVGGLGGFLEPSKVYGALASGRPILGILDRASEAARVILEAGAGEVVAPGDFEALRAAIERFRNSPSEQLQVLGAAGRDYAVSRCSRDQGTKAYAKLLRSLTYPGQGSRWL